MPQNVQNRLNFLINLAYYAAIIALVYLGFKYVLGWILPFILAFCIVSVVNPLIHFVNERLKIKHSAAPIIVMILTYILVGSLLFGIIITVVFLLRDMFFALPGYYYNSISPTLSKIESSVNSLLGQLPDSLAERAESFDINVGGAIQTSLTGISQMGISIVSNVTGHIPAFMIAFVFTIMLSFFISIQYDKVTSFIKSQLPSRAKDVLGQLGVAANDVVLKYLKAAIKLMFITFSELSIGLLVLRADNAIAIAAGIAVFDALPFLGTGAILVPWMVIELVQGNYTFAIGLGILYAIIVVVRNIIEPNIVGKKLGLNPIVTIVAMYLGFNLIGVLGMIIMPMTVQILRQLHKKGVIKFLRDDEKTEQPTESEINNG